MLRRAQLKNYDDPLGPRFEGQFATGQPDDRATTKIVTYNVCQGNNVEQAIEEFHALEPLQGADIILLQEMDEAGTEQMARALRLNYVYYPASVPFMQTRNLGNAVLARWPLTQPRKLILPYRHPIIRQVRIVVRATLAVGNREIVVYSAHTETHTVMVQHRRAQVAALVNDLGPGNGAVVVGGDFNTLTRRSIRRMTEQFAGVGLVRASAGSGPTVHVLGMPASATDHIFTRGFTVLASGAVTTAKASDHFPVWAELDLQGSDEQENQSASYRETN